MFVFVRIYTISILLLFTVVVVVVIAGTKDEEGGGGGRGGILVKPVDEEENVERRQEGPSSEEIDIVRFPRNYSNSNLLRGMRRMQRVATVTAGGRVVNKTTRVSIDDESWYEQKIPKTLWFTYKTNILKEGLEMEQQEQQQKNGANNSQQQKEESGRGSNSIYYDNVIRTIQIYADAWGKPIDTPLSSFVNFVDNDDCLELIQEAKPELVPYFLKEQSGAYKADICRAAALYLYGGYYFDIDVEIIEPYLIPDDSDTTYVTTQSIAAYSLFQAFIACIPRHPMLKQSLVEIHQLYLLNENEGQPLPMVGPRAMYNALSTAPRESWKGVHFLHEMDLDQRLNRKSLKYHKFPELERQTGTLNCQYIVHDPSTKIPHFYARFVGTPNCPAHRIPEKVIIVTGSMEGGGGTNGGGGGDIVKTKKPANVYRNVRNTIDLYTKIMPKMKLFSLDMTSCRKMVDGIEKRLTPLFDDDITCSPSMRTTLCQLATLYRHGGYVLDVRLEVMEPFRADENIQFVSIGDDVVDFTTMRMGMEGNLFVATIPQHPAVRGALLKILDAYESTSAQKKALLANMMTKEGAGDVLASAYRDLPETSMGKKNVKFLNELSLTDTAGNGKSKIYPKLKRQRGRGTSCNQLIHDIQRKRPYFYTSFVGYDDGCVAVNDTKGIEAAK